jgi:hypothetical protein
MQVFHTAGEPPSKGNKILPNSGCNTNISEALVKSVAANKKITEKFRLVSVFERWFIIIGSPKAFNF